jgi:ABC-type multidrug transport system permease subunit
MPPSSSLLCQFMIYLLFSCYSFFLTSSCFSAFQVFECQYLYLLVPDWNGRIKNKMEKNKINSSIATCIVFFLFFVLFCYSLLIYIYTPKLWS